MYMEEEKPLLICIPVSNTFELEKAVCSHGLFMMAPNLWISSSKTLQRPLRLADSTTIIVRISQDPILSSLHIQIFGMNSLSLKDEHAIKLQVSRMLRISFDNDEKINEFHKIHSVAKDRGFGRIFRSPTLFEDMVKCILLCNCQWSRTMSMARALCELQFTLKGAPLGLASVEAAYPNESHFKEEDFLRKTPICQEKRKKKKRRKCMRRKRLVYNLESKFEHSEDSNVVYSSSSQDKKLSSSAVQSLEEDSSDPSALPSREEESCCPRDSSKTFRDSNEDISYYMNSHLPGTSHGIGDFPQPEELAMLDEDYLARNCNLGYRANRIIKLSRSIVENKFQLRELEEICDGAKTCSYDELTQILSGIAGFGPFTCANVLTCMGYYHRIPADTETVRHLKQFYGMRTCTIKTVQRDVERIYEKYAPYQFLAYWMEMWDGYEKRFGKLSEMPHWEYGIITGSNMKKPVS